MAGDTDWLNKEESQFMRGTGNIVRPTPTFLPSSQR